MQVSLKIEMCLIKYTWSGAFPDTMNRQGQIYCREVNTGIEDNLSYWKSKELITK